MGPGRQFEYERVAPPKSLKDLPRYLSALLGGFFKRYTYIFRLVWGSGRWIMFSLLFIALCDAFIPVLSAYISKEILNEFQAIIVAGRIDTSIDAFIASPVVFLFIFFFICKICRRLITDLHQAVSRLSGELVVKHVKCKIMEKAKELDLSSFDLPAFYEKLENANREAGMRPIQILSHTFSVISSLLVLVFYLGVLSAKFPLIAVIMVIISLPTAIINFVFRRKNFNYVRRRSVDRRKMNYYSDIMVNKDLVKEIKILGISDNFINSYKGIFARYYGGLKKLIISENAITLITSVIASAISCLFYIIIGFGVFSGDFQIGDYSFYTEALTSISSSVSALVSYSAVIYEGTLFVDNLMSFLAEKPMIVSPAQPIPVNYGQPHTIEFRHVSFCYPGTSTKVLDDVSVTFAPGETAVLVGLNGAGKTTFIKLLTRLYDPTEGTILLDGHDLREYAVADLYKLFGIIFQDFGKYAVSISENISFGNIHAEPNADKVREAAHKSCADEYIDKLPEGYDTKLMKFFDPSATELSIGQWQKLAIARAFYSESDVLILDEPTASLDALAEQEIFNQFDSLRKDRTTIFVSHRLSSATIASKIVVLEYGKVIEEGTHAELMERGGRYHELFTTQAMRYIENH